MGGGVGRVKALAVEGGVEAGEHRVEEVGQRFELAAGSTQGDALVDGSPPTVACLACEQIFHPPLSAAW